MGDAIDDLIEEVIVDAYGPYEQLSSFRQVFEDTAVFPFAGRIIGVDVVVDEVDYEGDDLRGLVAICRRDGQRHTVSLLDVSLTDPVDPETAKLLAAYRRWAGAARTYERLTAPVPPARAETVERRGNRRRKSTSTR